MDNVITREEHDEFCKRIEAEEHRQNERLRLLEENVRQIGELTASVKQMASNMENMLTEQREQGIRLKTLEEIPAKKWKESTKAIWSAVLGVFGAALAAGIIYLLARSIS